MRPALFTPVAAAVLGLASLSAHAVLSGPTVSGNTITFTENFNGGTSFTGGLYVPGLLGDGYLTIGPAPLPTTASLAFTVNQSFTDLRLSFWYGTLGTAASYAVTPSLVPQVTLGNTAVSNPVNVGQMLLLNPGPGGLQIDQLYSSPVYTFGSPMAPGVYTLTFASSARALKIDDLRIEVTAVPEPSTYALMLAGLGVIGWAASRRRRQNEQAMQGAAA